ncbi:MAG: ABC transporter permease subunit [Proteobacteria bacterium]|nr:ABC transporter permease subunit [Pseudomonadota bacterium]
MLDTAILKAIFRREFQSYFSTPIALIFLTFFLIINGFFTFKLGGFYDAGQADLRAFFLWHPWLYLFIVPAISMRLWAEERRGGTIELLLTLPVSIFEAALGKFLAGWVFIGIALILTFPIVLTVSYLGDPDMGVILASYLGSFLMAGTFLAIGCGVSAISDSQVISFVIATAICLILILLGFDPIITMLSDFLPNSLVKTITQLSFPVHFEGIQRGIFQLSDFIYFISVMLFALVAGVIIIDRKKAD